MPLGRVPWGLIFGLHCLYSRVSRVSDANSTLGRSWGKSTARMTPAPSSVTGPYIARPQVGEEIAKGRPPV